MVAIMETIQKYVPVHSEAVTVEVPGVGDREVHADQFHHILFGGDMLTAKRARGSQHIRSNSARGLDRLEGLTPVAEDWHTKVCLIGVSCIELDINYFDRAFTIRLYGNDCTLVHRVETPAPCIIFAAF